MEWVILVLLIVSLAFNILAAVVLVRSREALEAGMAYQNKDMQRLIKELMLRLPPRPYGVNIDDRYQNMSIGPQDGRIPY